MFMASQHGFSDHSDLLSIQHGSLPLFVCLRLIVFVMYDTAESGYDYVRVYDGTSTSAPRLLQHSGNTIPSSVTANSGSMYIRLSSDSSSQGSGFRASYSSGSVLTIRPTSYPTRYPTGVPTRYSSVFLPVYSCLHQIL